jgi:hypothetical protein
MIVERTLRATSQRSLSPVREAIERRLPWRRSVSAEAPTRAIPSPWKRLPTPRRRRDRLRHYGGPALCVSKGSALPAQAAG